ncbi:MAG TPA: HPF/RaiA family ribosome-associated protein [Terriglobales bacterium]|jgi:RNA polymerase sigma factor (sigma-70 family)
MNVHISYRIHKTPDIEAEINHLVDKLRKRLQVFRPELVHLKGILEQNSAREGTTVSLNLRLPSGQMAAHESAPRPTAAIKSAFDELLQQLGKHKELLRSSHKWQRKRDGGDGKHPSVPFEETLAAAPLPRVCAEDVRSYVNAKLGRLQRFVEREIFFRESAEEIAPGAITAEEVIDEVIAIALSDGGEKPERLGLEPWLYRLALRAMNDMAWRGDEYAEGIALQDSARRPSVRRDEAELQFHQPDETFTEESVIPDRRVATPEDLAASDEIMALVQLALQDVARSDREAFILHSIEGFSIEEIAAIAGRPGEQVRASIVTAREHLRRSPPISGRFRGSLLQPAGSA